MDPKRCVVVVCASLLGLGIAPGCSSDKDSPAAPTPCAVTPAPPVQNDFCNAVASYDGRCGHCNDCTSKNLQNCNRESDALSDAFRAAYIACKDTASCAFEPAFSPCVEEKMKSAVPTAAQEAAKTDYCNRCNATNAADCAGFFSIDAPNNKTGPGYNVLRYGDAIATKALTVCNAECDPFRYAVCVALASCASTGGNFCEDGGICGPQ